GDEEIVLQWGSYNDNIEYVVYWSSGPNGPWERHNDIPVTNNPSGNTYVLDNLVNDVDYYIIVVGGITENGSFKQLSGQPISNSASSGIAITNPNIIVSKPRRLS